MRFALGRWSQGRFPHPLLRGRRGLRGGVTVEAFPAVGNSVIKLSVPRGGGREGAVADSRPPRTFPRMRRAAALAPPATAAVVECRSGCSVIWTRHWMHKATLCRIGSLRSSDKVSRPGPKPNKKKSLRQPGGQGRPVTCAAVLFEVGRWREDPVGCPRQVSFSRCD